MSSYKYLTIHRSCSALNQNLADQISAMYFLISWYLNTPVSYRITHIWQSTDTQGYIHSI